MSNRYDFLPVAQNTPAERKLQADALAMLKAQKAARAVMDREEAARDHMSTWARKAIAASRPAPAIGGQQAARAVMMRRANPNWTPEPAADPKRIAAAMRMDAAPAPAGGIRSAAEAYALMQRRLGGR